MSRSFPGDARRQHFFEEQFAKETTARLKFYSDQKAAAAGDESSQVVRQQSRVNSGLPQINPMEFAVRKKREEEETLRKIIEEARQNQTTEEMYPVPDVEKQPLYEGFSRERRGRYQYLRNRHQLSPDTKFTFPVISSWEYGWKINDEMPAYGRPRNARTSMIKDSLYARNGVPTLSCPDPRYKASRYVTRSYTFG